MTTPRAFLSGVALCAAVAALAWAWHASGDSVERERLATLARRAATLEHDLDGARRQIDALADQLGASARDLRAARARLAERGREPQPAEAPLPVARPPAPAPGPTATPPRTTTPADALDPYVLRTPEHQREWDAVVADALGREVQRRLGRTLTAEQTASLVATLGSVRDASRFLNEETLDPGDPASIREHAAERQALLDADRVFHEQLGMGLSAFLQGLSADKVEEAFPPHGPR